MNATKLLIASLLPGLYAYGIVLDAPFPEGVFRVTSVTKQIILKDQAGTLRLEKEAIKGTSVQWELIATEQQYYLKNLKTGHYLTRCDTNLILSPYQEVDAKWNLTKTERTFTLDDGDASTPQFITLNQSGKLVLSENATKGSQWKFDKVSDPVNHPGNPIIRHIRTADPSAHVWKDGKMWLYTSHDQDDAVNYTTMDGYHAFSSSDLISWTDHGEILHSRDVSWGRDKGGLMFAPSAGYKDGTYYLYFPHMAKGGKGWKVGVATSSKPEGPFVDQGFIKGTDGIDPCCFMDDDGQAYLYWGAAKTGIKMAKLKPNMRELAEEPRMVDYGADDCHEGTFVHKYKGTYYFSYKNKGYAEQGSYAMSKSPYGPFSNNAKFVKKAQGAQIHHSIVEFKGQWYFFNHCGNYDGGHLYKRNSCMNKLFYNPDGTIQTVELIHHEPTAPIKKAPSKKKK
ncbi:family 43 glycosylhydrolase [Pontiella agarivorans]|uniref:Family 43 glycosylhydrolase n=1 Tax=Pontiella agarivorans TaxID=3038953 RepID=A0ABU5MYI1_9BACT|nr:family 43 glycosylhydrolase [Pontiella agarivorans]MDZ8119146.1 family 43 glycosylhydrolase [Pontiella agarivorans]